ncbi:MAG: putative lipid II flippase FtsW [Spirochaetaceae bacterium]
MSSFAIERVEKNSLDLGLVIALLLLVGVGVSVLFSSSFYRAGFLFSDPLYFLRRQLLWVFLGGGAAVLLAHVSLSILRRLIPIALLVTAGLMVLTFVPGVGSMFLGARRWIILFGFSFQPSELVKAVTPLYLAYILSRKHEQLDDAVNALLPPVIVVAVFATLIYLQNDFSMAFFLVFVSLAMLFVAGVPLRYFIALGVMTAPLSVILLLTRAHRVNRIVAFLDPNLDPGGTGYQVLASRTALAQGGLWGAGIGQGMQKFGALPEAHSDFVFAILAEELGFVGVFLVVLLFAFFAYRGFRIAYLAKDRFVSLLAFGITASITFQALLNMAVVSGLVPATGVPLPFFASGGSSMFVSLAMCGLLVNLSRRLEYAEEPFDG